MSIKDTIIKGRGAQIQVPNRFDHFQNEWESEFLEYCHKEGQDPEKTSTSFVEVYPKSIVNKVKSPDVGMSYSLNPYQGCEHGCIYCYARNTHEYWGYGAGLDFERKIMVKKNAPALLEKQLNSKSWKAKTIVLSGNTDCYQPAERKYKLTRSCLEVFLKYQHPVGIITKNAAVLRDLDLLEQLAADRLIAVHLSITSLSEKTRNLLEPRTASIKKRWQAVKELSERAIPVNVMIAPIIPGLNSHEIIPIAAKAKEMGATSIGFTVVRLNGAVGQIFEDWIWKKIPNKAAKTLNQIKDCHGGKLNDSRFGVRNKGEGELAESLRAQFKLAQKKYFNDRTTPVLNTELFASRRRQLNDQSDQLSLF